MDADDLIPQIDQLCPELWLGIDTDLFPYLRRLRKAIEESDETLALSDLLPGTGISAATDLMFVPLHLNRPILKAQKYKGKTISLPSFVQMPVEGILKISDTQVLILGEAGAGKSTSIRRIAYKMAEKSMGSKSTKSKIQIPVILRATDIAESSDSIVEICAAETMEISLSGKPCFSDEDLKEGNVSIFVDALDEVPNNERRQQILARLKEFNKIYPRCKIIWVFADSSGLFCGPIPRESLV